MMWINMLTIASSSKMWIKPPNVYEETIPNIHRIISNKKIVQSMEHLQGVYSYRPSRLGDGPMGILMAPPATTISTR
jgi:hypothetical protein